MNRAIIYIASGQQYIDEAVRSAESVGGQYPTFLFTPDVGIDNKPIDYTISIYPLKSGHWYLDSVYCFNLVLHTLEREGIDQALYLDTDTCVCGDLTDFFAILDRFDIAGTQAIGRETMLQRDDIPASFPELHVGAFSFNRNSRVEKLFELWLKLYQDDPEFYGDNDQGPLREALWKSPDIKLGILPAEFCFRYRWGGLVNGQVRVLHGRENNTPYEQIAREVNGQGIRVYQKRELA